MRGVKNPGGLTNKELSIISQVTFTDKTRPDVQMYAEVVKFAKGMAKDDPSTTLGQNLRFLAVELDRMADLYDGKEVETMTVERARILAEEEAEAVYEKTGEVLSTSSVNSIIDAICKTHGIESPIQYDDLHCCRCVDDVRKGLTSHYQACPKYQPPCEHEKPLGPPVVTDSGATVQDFPIHCCRTNDELEAGITRHRPECPCAKLETAKHKST